MADVLFGKTEVDAVSEELILGAMVQEQLIQEAKLLNTVSLYPAPMGVDKVKIPKAGGFTVGNKTENTAVESQTITYSTDDLSLDKHKVIQVLLEKFAVKQSKVNALVDISQRAGKAMALQLDTDIIAGLEAVSTSAPDHAIAYAGSTIAQVDILEAIRLLKAQYVNPANGFLGINPTQEKAMLQIADFVRYDAQANANGLQFGILGKIYGLNVIVHTGFDAAKSIVWVPEHVGVAIQEQVTYDMDKDLPNLAERHSWDMIYGVKTLASGVKGVLLGTASP